MTTPAEARRIEQRSLRFGVGANAVMALAGFSAHVLTGSSALLLDGLYSAVLVGSSLIASRISRNVVRPPDRAWPYGYEGQEALYVLFRSLVLLGVIGWVAVYPHKSWPLMGLILALHLLASYSTMLNDASVGEAGGCVVALPCLFVVVLIAGGVTAYVARVSLCSPLRKARAPASGEPDVI